MELVLKATMTGSEVAFFVHARLIWLLLNGVAVKLTGLFVTVAPVKRNEISFVVVFSVIEDKGKPVFAPAQEWEWGVVASVKDVLLPVPGNGHPVPFMVPYVVVGLPVAFAQTGYIP